jgi:cell division protein FtsI (penicillin-binding protein 3)
MACYLILTLLVGWRLVSVQILAADEYAELAERQTQREVELPATRGKLYDRTGEPLAMSLAASTVYADPRALADGDVPADTVAAELAPLLERPVEELTQLLTRDAGFVYLARQQDRQVGEQIEALRLPGIGVLEEPSRTYPADQLAAQVVGFAGVDNSGLAGMEAQYDGLLAGEPGSLQVEQAPGGLTISAAPTQTRPAVAGTDLVLTIDRQVQYAAERVLEETIAEHNAKGGSAVVLDVDTGDVLAMASAPGFEPESIGTADAYARSNRVVTDLFEPGSVNKVVTAAAALEEGVVSPSDQFTVADTYRVGSSTFRDNTPHAPWHIGLGEIIARSSNVGTIQVAQRLGPERLDDYLRRFGFAQPTDVGFPGESAGLLPQVDDWWESSLPTIAIGYGVSATLLQVAGVFQTVASDGQWVQPRLMRGTVGPDGRLDAAEAGERRDVISSDTARALREMLVGAVESEHGTGGLAAVPGYGVGGKTGTARKSASDRRGYAEGKYIATFAGFAPQEDPELVVAVMIDEPRPAFYGGVVAAPAFREIMEFTLGHRRVAPERETALESS